MRDFCLVCDQDLKIQRYDDRFCSLSCGWASVFGGRVREAVAESQRAKRAE